MGLVIGATFLFFALFDRFKEIVTDPQFIKNPKVMILSVIGLFLVYGFVYFVTIFFFTKPSFGTIKYEIDGNIIRFNRFGTGKLDKLADSLSNNEFYKSDIIDYKFSQNFGNKYHKTTTVKLNIKTDFSVKRFTINSLTNEEKTKLENFLSN